MAALQRFAGNAKIMTPCTGLFGGQPRARDGRSQILASTDLLGVGFADNLLHKIRFYDEDRDQDAPSQGWCRGGEDSPLLQAAFSLRPTGRFASNPLLGLTFGSGGG